MLRRAVEPITAGKETVADPSLIIDLVSCDLGPALAEGRPVEEAGELIGGLMTLSAVARTGIGRVDKLDPVGNRPAGGWGRISARVRSVRRSSNGCRPGLSEERGSCHGHQTAGFARLSRIRDIPRRRA